MEIKYIENLANLCRIELSEDEKKELLLEMGSILGFIDQIQKVKTCLPAGRTEENSDSSAKRDINVGYLRNIMREDENPYVGGEFTDAILAEAPSTEGQYVKVKKIL